MRRLLLSCALIAAQIVFVGAPARAADPRVPQVQILGLDGTTTGPEGEVEHVVVIEARDPDGVIVEVQVEFGDDGFVFAHTYCVLFGVGETARMRIGHSFPGPGTYDVHARALSVRECGARGSQTSRWATAEVTVPA